MFRLSDREQAIPCNENLALSERRARDLSVGGLTVAPRKAYVPQAPQAPRTGSRAGTQTRPTPSSGLSAWREREITATHPQREESSWKLLRSPLLKCLPPLPPSTCRPLLTQTASVSPGRR